MAATQHPSTSSQCIYRYSWVGDSLHVCGT